MVSFVWGPGQKTPVHDHTVWGVIGMLRGAERAAPSATRAGASYPRATRSLMQPGRRRAGVAGASATSTACSNAFDDRVSISIHAYGANIGKVRRHVFDPQTGATKEFVSGYANA